MGDVEIKSFLQGMYPIWLEKYGPDKLELLNKNWQILAFGEALGLNTAVGQEVFLRWLEYREWEGVFVDSIGSAIVGNINSAENVQPFTNFNDKVRKRYGCFLWYIHHFRKPPPGTKSSGGAEDSYGDVYLTNRATTLVTVTRKADDILRIKNPKNRHAKELPDFLIKRESGLYFSKLENDVVAAADSLVTLIKNDHKKAISDQTPKPFGQ